MLARRDLAIVLDGGEIVDIVPGTALPPDIVTHEHGDATLLPGLVDAHVHLVFPGTADPIGAIGGGAGEMLARMRAAARRSLAAGVTTVRDLGDAGYLATRIRAETARDPGAGPEILTAGPPITTPGGHCWFLGAVAQGPAQLRAQVAEHVARGVDVIKVMASGGRMTPGSLPWSVQFSPPELDLIRAEAHRTGLPVTAHAHGTEAIVNAVRAGFDGVEHATFTEPAGLTPRAEVLDELAAAPVFVSLGLGTHPDGPSLRDAERRRVEDVLDLVDRMHKAGVTLVCSSDAGVSANKPHGLLPHSIAALSRTGVGALGALRAATAIAAEACRVGDRKGRIANGYDADLLVVAGYPVADIGALRRVVAVYRAGKRL